MKSFITTLTTIGLLALFVILFTHIHLPSNNTPQTATVLTATEIKAKIADLKAQLATVAPVTTPSYNFTRNLTVGSKGDDVLELQTFLKSKGYLTITTPTTYFGPLTRTALGKWQASQKITPAQGYFGPVSRKAFVTTTTTNTQAGTIQAEIDALNAQLATLPNTITTTTTTTTVRTDFTSPTLSSGIPTGTLSTNTSTTTLGITTNEASTCRFSSNYNPYESMENTFEVTGGTTHTSTVSNLSNGRSYTFHIQCKDSFGNVTPTNYTNSFSVDGVALGTGGSPIVTSSNTVDTTVPVRSSGSPGGTLNAGTQSTTLSLTTNETSTCKYATTSLPYLSMTTFTTTGNTTHSSNITGLANSSSYTYYVRCKDTANNTNTDDFTISFQVAAQGTPPDTTAPTVSISSPTGGTQSGTITITATASDNIGISKVQFKVDGTLLSEDTSSPYSYSWNTTTTTNAVHTLTATAFDTASNMTTSSGVSITVNNVVQDTQAPTLSSPSPTGSLASSTQTTNLTLTSNESATCRYSTSSGVAYSSMTNNFSSATGTTHSTSVTVSTGNSYSYYVKCIDASSNASSDLNIVFSVASSSGGGGGTPPSGAIWYDDFQSYTSLSQITHATVNNNAWTPAVGEFFYAPSGHILFEANSSLMTLDLTGGPNNDKVLTYHWPVRSSFTSYYQRLNPYFTSFPQTSQIWVKWKDKLSSNFAPGGAGCTGASCEYKFLLLATNNGGAIQMELENGNSGAPNNNIGVRIKQLGIQNAVSDGSVGSGDIMDYKPAAGALVNQWNTWAIGITGIGTTSTQTTVYLNGTAILTLPAKNWLGSGVYPSSYFSLEMGANINNGPDQTQTRSWREIGVYTSQPSLQ